MSTYNDASLIYYPSGYKASKAYSLKPTDGSGDLSFTRASTATRVNESGLIEEVATGVPRIDFTGGGCGKLLLEPQRTNLVFPSQDFNAWGKTTISVTNNSTTSPDGTINASKIIPPSGTSGGSYVSKGAAGNSMYVFAKAAEKSKILIYSGVSNSNVWFDVTSGQVLTKASNAVSASIENYGNGWYKCSIIWTTISSLVRIYGVDADNSTSVVGNGTDGLFIWGAQVEDANFPTSYIPTTSTAVTRVADDMSLTSASVATIAPTSGFTLFMDFYLSQDQETSRFSLFDNAYQNYVYLGSQDRPTNQSVRCEIRGSGVRFINYEPAFMSIGRHKMAVKFLTSDIKIYLDGVEVASSGANAGLSASFQNIIVGRDYPPTAGAIARSITESLMIFPTALSDAECIALTTL